eukprot:3245758-Rhodomonas_salina.2
MAVSGAGIYIANSADRTPYPIKPLTQAWTANHIQSAPPTSTHDIAMSEQSAQDQGKWEQDEGREAPDLRQEAGGA